MIQNVTNQVVEGSDFFDREREIARYWKGLQTDNLLLLAPRRVGKSSVLRRMNRFADKEDFTGIYLDVSDCRDELHFVQRLYSAILDHHNSADRLWKEIENSWLGKTIKRVKKAGVGVFSLEFEANNSDWARMGEELAGALESLEGKTLIQVDELPVFVLKLLNRTDPTEQGRIREFLYWLRRLRQAYPRVRWMLAGSIGLDTVAARLNIADSINDLGIETLGAFSVETANALLQELAKTYQMDLEDSVREHILARVGWPIPHYLQLIFHKLRDHSKPRSADVNAAVETLLDPHHKSVFDYWRQRLRDEMGRPDADYATALLNASCRTPSGVRRSVFQQALNKAIPDADSREEKLRYVLDVLENDGYVVEHEKLWMFRSPLVREYWSRRVAPPEADDE